MSRTQYSFAAISLILAIVSNVAYGAEQEEIEQQANVSETKEADSVESRSICERLNEIFECSGQDKDRFKHSSEGKYKKLLAQYNEEKQRLYLELGAVYIKAKMFDASLRAYDAVLEINPRNKDAVYALGILHRQYKRDSRKAIGYFKKYLSLAPAKKERSEAEYLIKMLENE